MVGRIFRLASGAVALPLTLAVLAFGAGCGGGDSSSPSAEADVKAPVEAFYAAMRSGDGAAACAVLTPAGQEALLGEGSSGTGSKTCADPPSGPGSAEAGKDIRLGEVTIDGDTATLEITGFDPEDIEKSDTVRLVRDGGDWKIDGAAGDTESAAADGKAKLFTAQTAMETYAVDHGGHYAGATEADLVAIEPTLAEGVPLTAFGALNSYSVSIELPSGVAFTINRKGTGETLHFCNPPGDGDCPASGRWD
jgi:hypothetical protein